MKSLLQIIKNYKSLSIIGMDKNVGKTTTLNYIINEARDKYILGLTSIGRDGEEEDVVFQTSKPKIYVQKGTIVATAKDCFFYSDVTKEIINTTKINTPMGEVIVFKALSDGYIQIAGPSVNSQLKNLCDYINDLGTDLVIIDGALSRKTLASPSVTESSILCTGAALDRSINKVVENTIHTVNLLSMKNEEDENILNLAKKILDTSKVGIIYKNNTIKKIDVITSLDSVREIVENLNDNCSYIVVNGIISDKFLEDIMKSTEKYKEIIFLIIDGTKLFINKNTLYKFIKTGGNIKVIKKINLIGISANPKSPYGYEFDKYKFLDILRSKTDLPVFDVIGGD